MVFIIKYFLKNLSILRLLKRNRRSLSIEKVDFLKGLQPGTGEVVKFEGKKVAAYRDDAGTLHTLSPTCTHAGCIVSWNGEEKSWDCPCHGARYDINGEVITGPATKGLAKIDV
ncbi:(2Fe-2S)-binding protein [Mucilaginibacter galii]|uniref:(2Fe-2S)-binding protein n=1 Tax=Mucilaginibacter galii TaxID=2005073 RepID=UPI0016636C05|nr:(2Fe-2S)-binding protein [Mucilaginibacter galii]